MEKIVLAPLKPGPLRLNPGHVRCIIIVVIIRRGSRRSWHVPRLYCVGLTVYVTPGFDASALKEPSGLRFYGDRGTACSLAPALPLQIAFVTLLVLATGPLH